MRLLILIDLKDKIYNLILIIIDHFIKMIHYKLVKIMINILNLIEIIINIII